MLVQFGSPSAANPAEDRKSVSPMFVVYASEEDAEFGSSLFRVLRGNEKFARFDKAQTIEKAIASEADVLVLVLPKRELPKLEKGILEALKKRKIIGIGYGAAQLFGQLGLEINGGNCAHGVAAPPSVMVGKSELLGEPKNAKPLLVLREAAESEPDARKADFFGLFLPPREEKSSVVDVIARWTSDANYAPIVRQGNCVLIGIPVPSTRWTAPYADLIREMCLAMHERRLEVYSTARREVTRPGTYEFKLAKRGSIDPPFTKSFYFHFTEAKRFSAQLEHAGSDSVMLIFMGQDENRTHWTRQDARQRETLKITTDISREDIEKLGDRYWKLNVTNFAANTAVECKLTIKIEEP
jgi:hypothetical protein